MFPGGVSGNPSGRPKKSNKAAGQCREHTDKAIKVLIDKLASDKEEVQLKAAVEILNRGWGKPQEYVELSGDEENPVRHKLVIELVKPNANPGSV